MKNLMSCQYLYLRSGQYLCQTIRELSFFTGRGASVCDGRSPIFSGPPFANIKNILIPPFGLEKNSGTPTR